MMKKTGLDRWCHRAWIKVMCGIAAVMTLLILANWQNWCQGLKCIGAMAVLLPLHVIEEWLFPGGFHFQYNTFLQRSKLPDWYPMNRLSDMITNLGTTVMYAVIALICAARGGEVHPGLLLGSTIFCGLEVFAHTAMGTAAYFRFRSSGKTTIYGPGSVTAYTGFAVLGVIMFYELQTTALTGRDWLAAALLIAAIGIGFVLIPESTLKTKSTAYYFENNGYYDRFPK